MAQKLAAEAGVDLRAVTGTGPGGRITKEDVEQALKPAAPTAAAPRRLSVRRPAVPPPASAPLPGVGSRRAHPAQGRARHHRRPHGNQRPHDGPRHPDDGGRRDRVRGARERLKAKVSEEWGFAPGYNDLLAQDRRSALRQFPYMNARLAPDAIERLAHVNLGMAVDTERGLLVPVIRDADQKSLRQFGAEFREMVDRARKGQSLPDDLSGGTFTITNLGMYDIDAFTPVINLPEAAILGVGRIIPKWVYRPRTARNAPVLRQMMTLSLVFDHRLVDGAPAARFLQYIKELVEEPYLLLAE